MRFERPTQKEGSGAFYDLKTPSTLDKDIMESDKASFSPSALSATNRKQINRAFSVFYSSDSIYLNLWAFEITSDPKVF